MKVLAQTFERLELDALCAVKLGHAQLAVIKVWDLIHYFITVFCNG